MLYNDTVSQRAGGEGGGEVQATLFIYIYASTAKQQTNLTITLSLGSVPAPLSSNISTIKL